MRYYPWLFAVFSLKSAVLRAGRINRIRLGYTTRCSLPIAIGIGLSIMLTSCDTNRVFEDYKDLEAGVWTKDQAISFDFQIEDTQLSYNIYANIRNASAYPYHNLYFQYTLKDSSGNVLKEELQNVNLFDPKTGEPYGSGLGDLFDHQPLVLEDYEFTASGQYTISFEQYMRRDTLPMILSVGTRVEWSESE